jgi:hypothetical protein
MRKHVEARLDVCFENPLIGAGREHVNLGDRVMRPAFGANPYEQGSKSASKIGSSTVFRAA